VPCVPVPSQISKIKIYRTIILTVVLYGCETWCLTLREEHRLRVSENRVLRRISGPKREEVAGGWRRLHNEELHNLYPSPNIRVIKSRRMRWAVHIARGGEMRNIHKILARKVKRKTPLARPRGKWEDNIRMDLMEIGWEDVDWMHLVQNRALVNTVMNLRAP
jgi:hypothetical protein